MKKALSLIITFVMMLNFVGLVQVDAANEIKSIEPELNMEVGETGGTLGNETLNLTGTSASVDFRTTLYKKDVYDKFVKWYEELMDTVDTIVANFAQLGTPISPAKEAELRAAVNNMEVSGEFVIDIFYPKTLVLPNSFIVGGHMEGFDEGAKNIYYEKSRTLTTADANTNKLTIVVDVKSAVSGAHTLTAGELYQNKATYLDDMHLTVIGVTVPAPGTYTVYGTMSGYTEVKGTFNGTTHHDRIDYTGKQAPAGTNPYDPARISATVILTKPGTQKPVTDTTLAAVLKFNIDGNTTMIPSIKGPKVVPFAELPAPTKEGYTFDGWYYDSAFTRKVTDYVSIDKSITLYGHFISTTLDTEDHFAYIVGYADGTVKPQNNITREEVATIFYRLLREDKRAEATTTKNNFSDVDESRWSNKAISTLANGGYINGYADGTFGPAKPITRAEFATMATRYAALSGDSSVNFTDVNGHWAKDYINKAATAGWVNGYSDGSFGPQKYITRAEVMAIVNRMLVRYVDKDGVHADAKHWSDMNGSEWYYWTVIEATNAHDYERREDGQLEKWTAINENKIIKEFDEKEAAE